MFRPILVVISLIVISTGVFALIIVMETNKLFKSSGNLHVVHIVSHLVNVDLERVKHILLFDNLGATGVLDANRSKGAPSISKFLHPFRFCFF